MEPPVRFLRSALDLDFPNLSLEPAPTLGYSSHHFVHLDFMDPLPAQLISHQAGFGRFAPANAGSNWSDRNF